MAQTSLILKQGKIFLNGAECFSPEKLFYELLDQAERMPMELLPLNVVSLDVFQTIQEEMSRSYPKERTEFMETQNEYTGLDEE